MTWNDWLSVGAIVFTAVNGWMNVRMENRILQMRIYVTDHYVSKDDLGKIVERLERVLERLESRVDGRKPRSNRGELISE